MSTYFSKVIKAGERQREFNFRQIGKGGEPQYSVDVPDEKGNRVMFQMQKSENGSWRTAVQALPVWVQDVETALAEAIEENAKNDIELKRKK